LLRRPPFGAAISVSAIDGLAMVLCPFWPSVGSAYRFSRSHSVGHAHVGRPTSQPCESTALTSPIGARVVRSILDRSLRPKKFQGAAESNLAAKAVLTAIVTGAARSELTPSRAWGSFSDESKFPGRRLPADRGAQLQMHRMRIEIVASRPVWHLAEHRVSHV
jgi:hypothetical protein